MALPSQALVFTTDPVPRDLPPLPDDTGMRSQLDNASGETLPLTGAIKWR